MEALLNFQIVLTHLEAIAPTFLAIMSLVMFTPATRWLNYGIVIMAIASEFVPLSINFTAVLACVSCFVGLLIAEAIQIHKAYKASKALSHK